MKKKIIVTGPNGSFEGWIEIFFTNSFNPHSDHRIECREPYSGNTLKHQTFSTKAEAVELAKKYEVFLRDKLEILANGKVNRGAVEATLKDLGFN